jgi:hypothetical protein
MTAPGWYPDQNGGSGKKYWDGKAWHDAVPVAPSLRPSGQSAPAPPDPDTFLPKPSSRSKNIKNMLWWGLGGVVALIVVSNVVEQIWLKPAARSSAPAPNLSVPVQIPGVEAPVQSQDAPLGTPLAIHLSGRKSDSGVTGVVVRNLQQISAPSYLPLTGSLYAVNVGVSAVSGTTVGINPFFFAARTELGTNLRPGAFPGPNELPATDLPQGQKVSGWLTFDVPTGQRITEIILSDPLGAQLGRWTVQ